MNLQPEQPLSRPPLARAALVLAASAALACGSARAVHDGSRECTRCHGSGASAAPPRAVDGSTSPTSLGVGAHRAHVETGTLSAPFSCAECHVAHATAPVRVGEGPVVTFGALARADGAEPAWDHASARCSGVYCHGATLQGGTHVAPVWTSVGAGEAACGTCHGNPPPSHAAYGGAGSCHACHGQTVRADGTIDLAGGKHVNGKLDFTGGGTGLSCDTCHAAPPDTGAHRAHARGVPVGELVYGDLRAWQDWAAPGDGYAFGCGHCHPTDPALHFADAGGDGLPDVVLAPPSPAVAGDRLKARNAPGAAWSAATGRCSGVYCHSSGQASPTYVETPAWTAPAGVLGCGGCHANPPRYASGGAGAGDANSHLQLQADGWEWGHVGGLPGPWHGSRHGDQPGHVDAAPITCQACHYASVDAGATMAGGFFWLNTTGDHHLPGGDPGRLGSVDYARLDCATCHGAGGGAPAGAGGASPARHVNGTRDVVFDPRTALPGLAWLPAAPDRPSRPYWVTAAIAPPPGGGFAVDGATLSFSLAGAAYDPATKTCSSVACHLYEPTEVWGTPHEGFSACARCHGF